MTKSRLDERVAESAEVSRSRARALIIAGRVRVNGQVVTKPGTPVAAAAVVEVERPRPYVSRGGEKLEGALRGFAFDVSGLRALDVGASTGGFTDCLLAHGAAHVVALDVGYGQLDYSLRENPRVTVMERCNFRLLPDDAFWPEFGVVTIDASFISVVTLIARARAYLAENGAMLALVKPQFEAGQHRLGNGGVVRDPEVHRAILREACDAIRALELVPSGLAASPLVGPAGNREFFTLVTRTGSSVDEAAIERAVEEAHALGAS